MEKAVEAAKAVLKPISNWALFSMSVTAAFFIGSYYPTIKSSLQDNKTKIVNPIDLNQCSVSITDRGEMLIIRRNSGEFEVYDENVGLAVFKAYGSRITSNQPK